MIRYYALECVGVSVHGVKLTYAGTRVEQDALFLVIFMTAVGV
jgi:hypothetical protein